MSTMPPQRLALLKAILAALDDDLPRLVFADWLEENGTTDADAARVEFIRLGCNSKGKTRLSVPEGKWLDANWRRLLVGTSALELPGPWPKIERRGRVHRLRYNRHENRLPPPLADVTVDYERGFARRVGYDTGWVYRLLWERLAADEPLAYHCPRLLPTQTSRIDGLVSISQLERQAWSEAVFTRTVGGNRMSESTTWFLRHPVPPVPVVTYHPAAVRDLGSLTDPRNRQIAAVATAMTVLAREFVGLAESAAGG